MTGKIIKGIAGFYYVHDRQSRVYACKAKGIFRNRGIKPVVGDDVEFTVLDVGNYITEREFYYFCCRKKQIWNS